jgi:hypothetical protein
MEIFKVPVLQRTTTAREDARKTRVVVLRCARETWNRKN